MQKIFDWVKSVIDWFDGKKTYSLALVGILAIIRDFIVSVHGGQIHITNVEDIFTNWSAIEPYLFKIWACLLVMTGRNALPSKTSDTSAITVVNPPK